MNVVRRTQKRGVLLGTSLLLLAAACSTQVNPADKEPVGSQGQAVISTTLSTYTVGSTVVVNYDAMSGAASDWVAISEVGSPDTAFLKWVYTGGGAAGSKSFSGLPGGSYEARAYFDWAGTSSYTVQYRSAFTIQGTGAAVLTPPASVTLNAPIQIAYSGMPGNGTDWIAVATPGAPATSFLRWAYTNGAVSGTTNFAGLPAGNYVARAFYDYKNTSSFAVQAEAAFTVSIGGSPSLTPPASPGSSTQLNIAFANFPGHATDWVTVAAAGSADTSFLRYKYTNGALSGTADLGTLPDGNYEARGYANWAGTQSYTVIARQAFTVSTCAPETDQAFCSRAGKNCGTVSGTDNCGAARQVADCGTCTSPQTCGGAGTANVCGAPATTCGNGILEGNEERDPAPGPFSSAPVDSLTCRYHFENVAQLYCLGTCSWAGPQGCDQADADVLCKLRTGNVNSVATSYSTSTPLALPGFPCAPLGYGALVGNVRGVNNVRYQEATLASNHGSGTVIVNPVCTNP